MTILAESYLNSANPKPKKNCLPEISSKYLPKKYIYKHSQSQNKNKNKDKNKIYYKTSNMTGIDSGKIIRITSLTRRINIESIDIDDKYQNDNKSSKSKLNPISPLSSTKQPRIDISFDEEDRIQFKLILSSIKKSE